MISSEQTKVDTSDQPVYALSKKLQQMNPNNFGEGRYLPMSGKLHTFLNSWSIFDGNGLVQN